MDHNHRRQRQTNRSLITITTTITTTTSILVTLLFGAAFRTNPGVVVVALHAVSGQQYSRKHPVFDGSPIHQCHGRRSTSTWMSLSLSIRSWIRQFDGIKKLPVSICMIPPDRSPFGIEPLQPKANPKYASDLDPNTEESTYNSLHRVRSRSGVLYRDVLHGIQNLYPPNELDTRQALSRKDGYWPYLGKGKDPPQHLTYGEFDFYFFAEILDQAYSYIKNESYQSPSPDSVHRQQAWEDHVFIDLGSGMGRLVLAAAALHPAWRQCRGVEILPGIHQAAVDNLHKCYCHESLVINQSIAGEGIAAITVSAGTDDDPQTNEQEQMPMKHPELFLKVDLPADQKLLPIAPVKFVCASFTDPYDCFLGDASCIFVFSSCMTAAMMDDLAIAVGRQCRPGTVVITTDYALPVSAPALVPPMKNGDDRIPSGRCRLELLQSMEGYCWITGGASTAYLHRVVQSAWDPAAYPSGPWERPKLSLSDLCYQVIAALEVGELTDYAAFRRGAYNNMVFHEIPERFWPKSPT